MVNITVTTCGHAFHSACIFRALQNNETCPMCRNELVPPQEFSDYDSDESEDIDSDDEYESDEEVEPKVTVEEMTTKLTELGYTMADLIRLFIGPSIQSSENAARYTPEFIETLDNHVASLIDGPQEEEEAQQTETQETEAQETEAQETMETLEKEFQEKMNI